MGCCYSTEQDHAAGHGPPAPHHASSSAPNSSNAPAQTARPPLPLPPPHPHPHPPPSPPVPKPGNRPNKPLVEFPYGRKASLPDPSKIPTSTDSQASHSQPWTRSKLEKQRNDWWDTRVTGSPHIWHSYREMMELLRMGHVRDAQALLDASGCTCPTGKLWHGIFDSTGVSYTIESGWIIFEPERGLAPEGEAVEIEAGTSTQSSPPAVPPKGKGKVGEMVNVRCRLSSPVEDVIVQMSKGETVGLLKAKLSQKTNIDPVRFRLSYLGKTYNDTDLFPLDGSDAYKPGNLFSVFVKPDVITSA